MRLDRRPPPTRKAAKVLFVLRAMMASRPGKEKRAARRALKEFRRRHPKGSTTWAVA